MLKNQDFENALKLLFPLWKTPEKIATRDKYSVLKNLGWAYLGLKNYRQAEESLKSALAFNVHGAEAHYLLAKVFEAQGKHQESKQEMQMCVVSYQQDTRQHLEVPWLTEAYERTSGETK